MTSKEQQIRNSIIYILPVAVGSAIPLITLPIFTRILTKEDYGILALAQVYALFVTSLANFGLTAVYERNFFECREERRAAELLYSTLLFVMAAITLGGFITFILKEAISRWVIGSPLHGDFLFWTYCSTSVMSLKVYFLTFFKNREQAKPFAWYTIDETLLGVVFSLILVVYVRVGVVGLVWGQLIASLLIFSALSIRFLHALPPAFNARLLKESIALSYPLTPRIFLGVVGTQFDKYMIGLLATVGGVGIYSIGQKVANVIFTCMTAIQNVFAPQVYRRMFDLGDAGGESVGRYLTPFMYLSIALGIVIALFSEEIVWILTPPSFHDAVDIVTILSLLYGSYFFGKQPQLLYAKKTHITSLLTIVSIGLMIGISIPFIHRWGAMGAAWGMLLAGLISGAISLIVSQHYYEIRWEYGKACAIFLIFFGSALMIILMRHFEVAYGFRLLFKIISVVGYGYLGMKIHILTVQNYHLVRKMISPARA